MSNFEVAEPILNSPFEESAQHWWILETKGYDPLEEVKRAAAQCWIQTVISEGGFGVWHYEIARKISEVRTLIPAAAGA